MVLHYLKQEGEQQGHTFAGVMLPVFAGCSNGSETKSPMRACTIGCRCSGVGTSEPGSSRTVAGSGPRPEIEAAVFVDSKDDLRVLRRDGTVELLVSSPYLEQLGRCVVYLDEAHTRGTDLKLPPGSRAAVTLGPRLCKDKLVQGAYIHLSSSRF
jgi:hypothetical protein